MSTVYVLGYGKVMLGTESVLRLYKKLTSRIEQMEWSVTVTVYTDIIKWDEYFFYLNL